MRIVQSEDVTQGSVFPRALGQQLVRADFRHDVRASAVAVPRRTLPRVFGAIGGLSDRLHARMFRVQPSNNPREGLNSVNDSPSNEPPPALLQNQGEGGARSVTGGTQMVLPRAYGQYRGIGGPQGAGVQNDPPLIPNANPKQGREGVADYQRAPHVTRFGLTGDPYQQQQWGQVGTPEYGNYAGQGRGELWGGPSGFTFDYSGLETGRAPMRIPRLHRLGVGAQAGLKQHGTQQSWDYMTTGTGSDSGNGTGILTPRIGRGTEASRAGYRAANNLLTARSSRPDSFATVRVPSVFVPRSV